MRHSTLLVRAREVGDSAVADTAREEVDDDAPGGSLAGMKPRRKWIKMEKVPGQVELYKALEAAVKALRDYKQHSFPFLQRVKKTDGASRAALCVGRCHAHSFRSAGLL